MVIKSNNQQTIHRGIIIKNYTPKFWISKYVFSYSIVFSTYNTLSIWIFLFMVTNCNSHHYNTQKVCFLPKVRNGGIYFLLFIYFEFVCVSIEEPNESSIYAILALLILRANWILDDH